MLILKIVNVLVISYAVVLHVVRVWLNFYKAKGIQKKLLLTARGISRPATISPHNRTIGGRFHVALCTLTTAS